MDSNTINKKDVLIALEKYFSSEDFELLKWDTKSLNDEARLGYLGDHFLLEATVRRQGLDEEVSFFVKTSPTRIMHHEIVKAGRIFQKEVLFYNQLADELRAILSKLPPAADGSTMPIIPQCYLAKEKVLIMENLVKSNYHPVSPGTPFSLDFFLVSVRSIAHFHAASIVLEQRQGIPLSRKYPDVIYESFLTADPNHYLAGWHSTSVRAAVALIPLLEKYKERPDIVKKTQEALPNLVYELTQRVLAWPDTVNVFCHGDLWTNNILFKLDCKGNPTQAVLVDFQMLRYAPPAVDLVNFLTFSAEKEFIDKHFYDIMREYHNELSAMLLSLNVKPEQVLPWDEFLRTIEEMKKFGLVQLALKYPFSLVPASTLDPILDDYEKYRQHFLVDRTQFTVNLFQDCEAYRLRFSEVMESLIDRYILTE